jgi:hypothetical protein
MDPTMTSNTPTKTQNVLQRLYVLPNTYSYIETIDPTMTSSTPTKTQNVIQRLYVLPNTYS